MPTQNVAYPSSRSTSATVAAWLLMWPSWCREAGAEVRHRAHADGVLRSSGEQRRTGRRAQRRHVEVGELQTRRRRGHRCSACRCRSRSSRTARSRCRRAARRRRSARRRRDAAASSNQGSESASVRPMVPSKRDGRVMVACPFCSWWVCSGGSAAVGCARRRPVGEHGTDGEPPGSGELSAGSGMGLRHQVERLR